MIHNTTVWPSPAKLNLFLYITGQRDNGYHDLQTLFQFLDYGDELTITANNTGEITIEPELPGVPTKDNLIYRAADALRTKKNCTYGAHIKLNKNYPWVRYRWWVFQCRHHAYCAKPSLANESISR